MKVCFRCGVEQPLKEFYKHKGMADGHLGSARLAQNRILKRHYEKAKDDEWMESERVRVEKSIIDLIIKIGKRAECFKRVEE